jgi:hypothetical protein
MATHIWTLVCEQALVDRFSNNLTIINVVEQFSITLERIGEAPAEEVTPTVPCTFTVVTMWHRSDPSVEEESSVRVRLVSPSGKLVTKEQELRLELKGERTRARHIANYRGVPISENGDYKVQAQRLEKSGRWKTEATVLIPVQIKIDEPSKQN